MNYIDVCTGLSAATVAWHPLGWRPLCFAEIDRFPCAVLKHHYPDVPNHGDFTAMRGDEYGAADVLVGGTPCQDFSVAGLRAGMDGERGQLTVEFARLAGRLRSRWLVWENVPGVLSIDGGRAFGTFIGILGQLGYGVAYRVLDAQHFGVPQRRRRVFVVGYLGDWRRAAAVLFERHSLSGHPAPRREAQQVAPTIPSRRTGGGGLGSDFDCDGAAIACMSTGLASAEIAFNVGTTLNCNHEAPIVAQPVVGRPYSDRGSDANLVTHSLRAEGFDASEDGTGRGTPLVPVAIQNATRGKDQNGLGISADRTSYTLDQGSQHAVAIQAGALRENPASGPDGVGVRDDGLAYTLEARAEVQAVAFRAAGQDGFTPSFISPPVSATDGGGAGVPTVCFDTTQITSPANRSNPPAIAFSSKDYGADVGDTSPTLRAMGHDGSHANGGGQVAVACFKGGQGSKAGGIGYSEHNAPTLSSAPSGTQLSPTLMQGMAVRRLTPEECEALQGFPRGYTKIGEKTADGPRYKALGNSFAVPVVRWIGERIAEVEAMR